MAWKSKSASADLDSKWVAESLRDGAYPLEFKDFSQPSDSNIQHKKILGFELISNELLVDVTDTCNFNINTGIQRVVRNLVREFFQAEVPMRLVTWNSSETTLRELTEAETKVAIGEDVSLGHSPTLGLQDPDQYVKLIPTNCRIFIPELATQSMRVKRTLCMSKYTSNQLFALGYDAVPVLLPDTTSDGMVSAFTYQLDLLKNCKIVFGISNSTTTEFQSLFSGITSQGLIPPEVISVPLPIAGIGESVSNHEKLIDVPRFLIVGSHEPRKNHERILAAAEMLWQQDYDFELHFVGSRGWESDFFWQLVDRLILRNRKVFCHEGMPDRQLNKLYEISTALLSFSFHEGYGLPIAEAYARDLDVLTSRRGSQWELAKNIGAISVESVSVVHIRDAIAAIITENANFSSSRNREMLSSWTEYADKIYSQLDRATVDF